MKLRLRPSGRVSLEATRRLPIPTDLAWTQLRDFRRCARCDAFHREVRMEGEPGAGREFLLHHRLLGVESVRRGTIAWWREGVGYCFSDLALDDSRLAFPHAFWFALEKIDAQSCSVRVRISGRWTSNRLPQSLIKLWLAWNLLFITSSLKVSLLSGAIRSSSIDDRRFQGRQTNPQES